MTGATGQAGSEALVTAREALTRADWTLAFEVLAKADESEPLSSGDLMALAEAAYGAGHFDVTLETLERAHTEAQRSGDRITAGAAAARLAMHLIIDTGLLAPVRGWIKRSERTLDGLGETPVHAWLAVAHACERMLSGDSAEGRRWAQLAADIGTRHEVTSASAFGSAVYARCLIFEGEIDQGLVLLEEAATTLFSGELDALTAGCLYCEVVCAWQGLARYDLAEQWTDAMERFSHDLAVGSINGRCRVHRAEILRLRGALPEAEREALAACEELRPYLRYEFGWPLTELGRIRLTRGDLAGAEEAFVAAHEMGWDPQPGLALLRLAQGDIAGAAASIRHALDHPVNIPFKERPPNTDLRRAPLLEALVEITLAAGDTVTAQAACKELEGIATTFGGKALGAMSSLASGRVLLAEGQAADARKELQLAVRLWSEIAAPVETAIARTVLAQAHRAEGDEQDAELELRAAQSTLTRVGAQNHAVLASHTSGPPVERTTTTEPNTFRREADYWSIVFGGKGVLIRDIKGLHHLSRLLEDPGREFHVVDLVGLDRGAADTTAAVTEPELSESHDDDAGVMLDERAKESYRRRVREIDEDIAEAESLGDSERAARAQCEREFVVRELSRAVGLSGRDRRAGATSERARASVTRAIRHAIARIESEHPILGEHLDRAVRTGTYCVYLPDPRVPADWIL